MGSDRGDVNTDWTRLVHGTIQDTDQWNIPPAYKDRDNVNRSARTALTHTEKNACSSFYCHWWAVKPKKTENNQNIKPGGVCVCFNNYSIFY